jgi:sugar lactone lactonase YvrE
MSGVKCLISCRCSRHYSSYVFLPLVTDDPCGDPAGPGNRPAAARLWLGEPALPCRRPAGFRTLLLFTATPAKAVSPPITYTGTALTQFTGAGSTFSGLSPAGLSNPNGLVLDLSGNVYIADTGNNRIVEIPSGGTSASLFAITGLGATPLSSPMELAVDSAGNLYIADSGHNRIVKVPTTGSQAGMGTALSTGSIVLSGPQGVAVDTAGNVFIADTGDQQIVETPAQGSPTVLISSVATPGGSALTSPVSLATDPSNNLYILDVATGPHTGRLIEVTPPSSLAGTLVTFSSALTDKAQGLTVSNNGTLYVTDTSTIYVNAQGNEYTLFDNLNSFGSPVAIATDSKGAFYILDNSTPAVDIIHDASADFGHVTSGMSGAPLQLNFLVSSSAAISSFASNTTDFTAGAHTCSNGTTNTSCSINVSFNPQVPGLRRGALVISWASVPPGTTGTLTVPLFGIGDGPVAALSPATTAFNASTLTTGMLQKPYQETFDASRSWLYITDTTLQKVLRLGSPTSATVVLAAPNLTAPTGLVIDGAGNLFVADAPNIVEVLHPSTAPTHQTVNLNGFTLSNNIQSLSIDGSGNLIVDDAGNNRIVQLTPAHDGDGTLSSVYASVLASTTTSAGGTSYAGGTSAAVDNGEALNISDNTNNRVIKVDRLGTASVVNFASLSPGLATPHSVTLDPMGNNLYVVDAGGASGAQRISLLTTAGNASVMPYTGATLGSGTNQLTTVSPTANVDYCGLLVADGTSGSAQQVCLSPVFGALTFPTPVPVGGTSASPMTGTVTNLGDQDLAFTSISFPSKFPNNTADSNNCNLATYQSPGLPAGMSCDVSVEFTPTTNGTNTGSVSVLDNSQVPTSPQSFSMSGTGIVVSTTTTVALPSSAVPGQTVTITATVAASGSTPTGTVTFTDQTTSTTLASNVSLNAAGVATIATSTLALGSHTIQAAYTPTGDFAASNGSNTITIGNVTTTTVTVSLPCSTYGQPLTLTATVAGAAGIAGSVQFTDATALTTFSVVPLVFGVATAVVATPGVGTHQIQAVYIPSGNFQASSGSATVTIGQASSSTALTLSNGALTATVSPAEPGGGIPTGTVQFFQGSTLLGSGTLSGGTVTPSIPAVTLTPANSFTAVYSGDANFTGSKSAAVIQSVVSAGISRKGGEFLLDSNFDHMFDTGDQVTVFSGNGLTAQSTDIAVAGDWSGNGTTKIGLYRPSTGTWYLDYNGNGYTMARPWTGNISTEAWRGASRWSVIGREPAAQK